jgi:hypothetical protein
MAAHLMYTRHSLSAEQLSPAQMFFIGLLEDARVEYQAVQAFPGLKKLWLSLMQIDDDPPAEHETIPVLEGIAWQLLDPELRSGDDENDRFVAKFHAGIDANQDDNHFSWMMEVELYNLFAGRKAMPSLRLLERYRIPYRDDNRIIWHFEDIDWNAGIEYIAASQRQVRRQVSPLMMAHEVDCELAGDDAQEIWTCSDIMRPYEDDLTDSTLSFNELWRREPISDPFHYQEWDYQIQLHRPDWATVYERRQPKGDAADIDAILTEHKLAISDGGRLPCQRYAAPKPLT